MIQYGPVRMRNQMGSRVASRRHVRSQWSRVTPPRDRARGRRATGRRGAWGAVCLLVRRSRWPSLIVADVTPQGASPRLAESLPAYGEFSGRGVANAPAVPHRRATEPKVNPRSPQVDMWGFVGVLVRGQVTIGPRIGRLHAHHPAMRPIRAVGFSRGRAPESLRRRRSTPAQNRPRSARWRSTGRSRAARTRSPGRASRQAAADPACKGTR